MDRYNTIQELMKPSVGDYVVPDGWNSGVSGGFGNNLKPGDDYVDRSFPGCQFRLPSFADSSMEWPVNITVTGRVPDRDGMYRCKVEFVNDGEPSIVTGGRILLRS